jgi:MerR family transcriptional regulator, light-induced transcriptional regulator
MSSSAHLRIGELARRTGISPELLRAWERRYGLLRPSRSTGGLRLYSTEDEARVARMVAMIESGLSAAQAASAALAEPPSPSRGEAFSDVREAPVFDGTLERLTAALDSFDEPSANAALDELLSGLTLESVLQGVLLPYLRGIGDPWVAGTATVAQGHFASNVIRARLMGLARGWNVGNGRHVLLACPAAEAHELGLIMFGLVVSRRGWRSRTWERIPRSRR